MLSQIYSVVKILRQVNTVDLTRSYFQLLPVLCRDCTYDAESLLAGAGCPSFRHLVRGPGVEVDVNLLAVAHVARNAAYRHTDTDTRIYTALSTRGSVVERRSLAGELSLSCA